MADETTLPRRDVFSRGPGGDALTAKLPIRYVLFHPSRGIYLGEDCWSQTNPAGHQTAPTFGQEACPAEVDKIETKFPELAGTVRPRQVWPDKGDLASMEACANAGLPRWEA